MSDPTSESRLAGYEDAVPVSFEEDPGGASAELNKAAHEAYAEAHTTGKLGDA